MRLLLSAYFAAGMVILSPGLLVAQSANSKLTEYWAESFSTLLIFGCDILTCEPEDLSSRADFRYSVPDITVNLDDFDIRPEGAEEALTIKARRLTVTVSRDGIPSLNSFPRSIEIELSDVTLGQATAVYLASQLISDSPLGQRLLAAEFAREGVTGRVSLQHEGNIATLRMRLSLRSQDALELEFRFVSAPVIHTAMISERPATDMLSSLDPTTRGLTVWGSINWLEVFNVPTDAISLTFDEYALLDKIYLAALRALGTEGMNELWSTAENNVAINDQEISEFLRQSGLSMIQFFSSWRTQGHRGKYTLQDVLEVGDILDEGAITILSNRSASCRLGAGIWIIVPAIYAAAPFIAMEKDDIDAFARNLGAVAPFSMVSAFWDDEELENLFELSRCQSWISSFEHEPNL